MGKIWKKVWRKHVRPISAGVLATTLPPPFGIIAAFGVSQIK